MALVLILASAMMPAVVKADSDCEDGICTDITWELTPDEGHVGMEVSLIVNSKYSKLGGDYSLYWGEWIEQSNETNFKVLDGTAERAIYDLTVDFAVPEVPYRSGTYYVTLYNMQVKFEGPVATALFKVLPNIEINPSPASPTTTVSIKGTGFTASDIGNLTFDGKATDVTIVTDSKGSFTAEFTIPEVTAGEHDFMVTAEDLYNKYATAKLEIVPTISLAPEFPEIGSEVAVTGFGFASGSKISVSYDNIVVVGSPTTDSKGNFNATFNVPDSPESEHEVIVTDESGNVVTFSLPLEGKAPPSPAMVSPMHGQRLGWLGSQQVNFNWTPVSDASGTSYTLEIADNLNFFPLAPGMRKTGLTETSYSINLDPGTYYWRVRAIDGAGNESQWMLSPNPFKVGLFPIWSLVAGGMIFLIIFILLLRAFFRRLRGYY